MVPLSKRENAAEMMVILTAFIVVNLVSQAFQKPILLNGGRGSDGVHYYAVAENLSKGCLPRAVAPYVYCIGTPLLASLVSSALRMDLIVSFKTINIVGNLVTVILLLLWLRRYLDNSKVRTLMVLLFVTQWLSPVRFVYFYPVYVDPWCFVFLLAGLLGIYSFVVKPTWLSVCYLALVSFVGTIFKESVFVIPLALLFSTDPLIQQGDSFLQRVSLAFARARRKLVPMSIVPLVCGVMGLLSVWLIASQTNDYSFFKAALKWAYRKPILTYLTAWFITFGPMMILPIYDWRRNFVFLRDNQYLLIYLSSIAVLGWVGGSDTERILYWAMPVVYLLMGRSLQNVSKFLSARLFLLLILAQLISQRVFLTIPDPTSVPVPVSYSFTLALLDRLFSYNNMWSYFCDPRVLFVYLFLCLSFSIVVALWLDNNVRRAPRPTEAQQKAA